MRMGNSGEKVVDSLRESKGRRPARGVDESMESRSRFCLEFSRRIVTLTGQ